MIRYARGLQFEATPDYDSLRRIFQEAMIRENIRYDCIFDWTVHRHFSSLATPVVLNAFTTAVAPGGPAAIVPMPDVLPPAQPPTPRAALLAQGIIPMMAAASGVVPPVLSQMQSAATLQGTAPKRQKTQPSLSNPLSLPMQTSFTPAASFPTGNSSAKYAPTLPPMSTLLQQQAGAPNGGSVTVSAPPPPPPASAYLARGGVALAPPMGLFPPVSSLSTRTAGYNSATGYGVPVAQPLPGPAEIALDAQQAASNSYFDGIVVGTFY